MTTIYPTATNPIAQMMKDINPYYAHHVDSDINEALQECCKSYESDILAMADDSSHIGHLTKPDSTIIQIEPWPTKEAYGQAMGRYEELISKRNPWMCATAIGCIASIVLVLLVSQLAAIIVLSVSLLALAHPIYLTYGPGRKILQKLGQHSVLDAQQYFQQGPLGRANEKTKRKYDYLQASLAKNIQLFGETPTTLLHKQEITKKRQEADARDQALQQIFAQTKAADSHKCAQLVAKIFQGAIQDPDVQAYHQQVQQAYKDAIANLPSVAAQ